MTITSGQRRVVFRVDASQRIGTGHVIRCLTLADQLRNRGAEITFICRDYPTSLCDYICKRGYVLKRLPVSDQRFDDPGQRKLYGAWLGVPRKTDAVQSRRVLESLSVFPHWLVVDHYSLDIEWEERLRPCTGHIMVIDDLADRQHDCDILLDQGLHDNAAARYTGLLPSHCQRFLGPQYALLRREFISTRAAMKPRSGRLTRILVYFGGADVSNETVKTLRALQSMRQHHLLRVDVILGLKHHHKHMVSQLAREMEGVTIHTHVKNMAALMSSADLALGGGGTTTWERCFLGLPSFVIVLADNQREVVATLQKRRIVRNLGWHANVTSATIQSALEDALSAPNMLREMSQRSMDLVRSENSLLNATLATTMLEKEYGRH